MGLRERKKHATMHAVQAVALDLFEEHGFQRVTVEQVAEAASVSPSTVYRYFATKEGLVLRDEFDDQILESMATLLNEGSNPVDALMAALATVAGEHFAQQRDETLRRTRLIMEVPSLRGAMFLRLAEVSEIGAALLSRTGRYSEGDARAIATSLLHNVMAAFTTWAEGGGEGNFVNHAHDALSALTSTLTGSQTMRGHKTL